MNNTDKQSLLSIIDDFKSDSKQKRINSIKSLGLLAKSLGEDRMKQELIPFINSELIDEEDDDVLLALSDQLKQFCTNMVLPLNASIVQQQQLLFFPAFEILSGSLNQKIKELAVEGFRIGLGKINISKNEEYVMKLIKRLGQNDNPQTKYAAAMLIPFCYPSFTALGQNEAIGLILNFANDDYPMVRKFAAMSLKNLVKLLPNLHENEILFILQKLSRDDQDYIKIFLIDTLIELASSINLQVYFPCFLFLLFVNQFRNKKIIQST